MKKEEIISYNDRIGKSLENMRITDKSGNKHSDLSEIIDTIKSARGQKKLIFIGNGGSAAIAAHYAQDFTKIGKIRSKNFNDPQLISMVVNDFSRDEMFSKPIEWHADEGDVLIAISSSGQSNNILNGAKAAQLKKCKVITLSSFEPNNPLSSLGDYNIYVAASKPDYGIAESAHSVLLHAILDQIAKENFA
ncbi:SIS domain-containing protein [Candidatus Giovannonibacteria bacterium]|nr:SIS domain-containing protein [Candidatus Giovannonibacteria bacterium]